jgi:hypothetical protein
MVLPMLWLALAPDMRRGAVGEDLHQQSSSTRMTSIPPQISADMAAETQPLGGRPCFDPVTGARGRFATK